MTWRRFLVLLNHLPPDSIFALTLAQDVKEAQEAEMAKPENLEAHLTSLGW